MLPLVLELTGEFSVRLDSEAQPGRNLLCANYFGCFCAVPFYSDTIRHLVLGAKLNGEQPLIAYDVAEAQRLPPARLTGCAQGWPDGLTTIHVGSSTLGVEMQELGLSP
jgi:hypothetical protein